MAEQKAEKEGEVAEEPIMSLSSDDSTSEIVALSPGGGAAQALTDEQIIACAVIGAKTGNATIAEMAALRGKRPDLVNTLEARGGSSELANLGVQLTVPQLATALAQVQLTSKLREKGRPTTLKEGQRLLGLLNWCRPGI